MKGFEGLSGVLDRIPAWATWTAAGVLTLGAVLVSGALAQELHELRRPLASTIPGELLGLHGRDSQLPDWERDLVGVTDHLIRIYEPEGTEEGALPAEWMSLYVGFYNTQTGGKTIHSPKNCMPGAGWEALNATRDLVPLPGGEAAEVNRYVLMREGEQVLVLYWYQGRGRVVASEFQAKWDLLKDAAVSRRSDETLVRIVVPIPGSEEEAFEKARTAAEQVIPALFEALPSA
jgi:EpsI family protein